MLSGTDMARAFPDTAVRVFYVCAREGGDVRNAWDVLVSAHGADVASQLVRDGRPDDADLGEIIVTNRLGDYVTPPLPLPPLPQCDSPVCDGHLGKFQTCTSEALYKIGGEWGFGDTTGSVEAFGHFTLLTFDTHVHVPLGTGPVLSARIVTIRPGSYMVEATDSGFIYVHQYDDEEAGYAAFTAQEDAYAAWDTDEDED